MLTVDLYPDGRPPGSLLEEQAAADVSVLPADVQQQVQPKATHSQHAHRRQGARLRDLPEEGEEQMVSQASPRHSSRCSSQKVNSFQVSQQHLSILKSILSGTCCI